MQIGWCGAVETLLLTSDLHISPHVLPMQIHKAYVYNLVALHWSSTKDSLHLQVSTLNL